MAAHADKANRVFSTAAVWRPGRFLIAFHHGILELRIEGRKTHDSAFYFRDRPDIAFPPDAVGAHDIAPAHRQFIADILMG